LIAGAKKKFDDNGEVADETAKKKLQALKDLLLFTREQLNIFAYTSARPPGNLFKKKNNDEHAAYCIQSASLLK